MIPEAWKLVSAIADPLTAGLLDSPFSKKTGHKCSDPDTKPVGTVYRYADASRPMRHQATELVETLDKIRSKFEMVYSKLKDDQSEVERVIGSIIEIVKTRLHQCYLFIDTGHDLDFLRAAFTRSATGRRFPNFQEYQIEAMRDIINAAVTGKSSQPHSFHDKHHRLTLPILIPKLELRPKRSDVDSRNTFGLAFRTSVADIQAAVDIFAFHCELLLNPVFQAGIAEAQDLREENGPLCSSCGMPCPACCGED
ncbi:MAG: hypothetical protein M1814_003427 [Vezdaea aestivalis]|nr:MAG: hypothetical protein M1814_003427 [Vezdaea aestivalis]